MPSRFNNFQPTNTSRIKEIELKGGKIVEFIDHEPNPNSYRSMYYYNTTTNKLFVKTKTKNKFYWKEI